MQNYTRVSFCIYYKITHLYLNIYQLCFYELRIVKLDTCKLMFYFLTNSMIFLSR